MQTQAIPSVKYSLPVEIPATGNAVKDELGELIELHPVKSFDVEAIRKLLMTGAVLFMINKRGEDETVGMVVLTTKLTGRVPTMTLLTQMQTTQIVNKYNDTINKMFIQLNLGDRREYDHLIVGLPDNPVQGQ